MPNAPKTFRQQATKHKGGAPPTRTQRVRNSARWQHVRAWVRRQWPLCCDPFGEHKRDSRVEATTDVHHIESIEQAPVRALDASNCAPLCRECHARVTRLERQGRDTRVLFEGFQGQKAKKSR